ncbi:MAG: SDR family oxidoreductase [Ignavibacteriaceae bacterium]|nr:SDR family oxidoreductase [Ignavibacteriaceae bacterium]
MKKVFIIAGHKGIAGGGVYEVLKKENFDQIILLSKANSASRSDLSEPHEVQKLFSAIVSDKGMLYYLFSSVGGFTGGRPIWEAESRDSLLMMNKNYLTAYNLLHEFSKLIKLSAGGAAVLLSAWSGSHPDVNRAAYSSSKAALNHLIRSVALEGKSINLSVCGIAPYLIDTPENRTWMPEEKWPTMQKPEEIGEIVSQLFRFSHCISGNILELGERIPLLNFGK